MFFTLLVSMIAAWLALFIVMRAKRATIKLYSAQTSVDVAAPDDEQALLWLHRVMSTDIVTDVVKHYTERAIVQSIRRALNKVSKILPVHAVSVSVHHVRPSAIVRRVAQNVEPLSQRVCFGGSIDAKLVIDAEINIGFGFHLPFRVALSNVNVEFAALDITISANSVQLELPFPPSLSFELHTAIGPAKHPLALEDWCVIPLLIEGWAYRALFRRGMPIRHLITDDALQRFARGMLANVAEEE